MRGNISITTVKNIELFYQMQLTLLKVIIESKSYENRERSGIIAMYTFEQFQLYYTFHEKNFFFISFQHSFLMFFCTPSVVGNAGKNSSENIGFTVHSPNGELIASRFDRRDHMAAMSPSQLYSHPSISFGLNASTQNIQNLFEQLISLRPMDKNGSMSGNCDYQTTQMETFLSKTFEFKNIDGKDIVQGVKSFRLGKPVNSIDPSTIVYFPSKTSNSFAMSVQEILEWQQSYRVYTVKNAKGMSEEFLKRALQGRSAYGDEAFLMKFVIRISQCPILMEFDAHVISRQLGEQWPHRIKLVSVTGIDFAGRIHDLNDIRNYVTNWSDVYEIDPKSNIPFVYNGRDFRRRHNAPRGELDKKRVLTDLMRMAKLRLRACDSEKVKIVVETGIGLGVFAGRDIGIDETVRELSATAIRKVLEEDGSSYQHIRGIVFALPVFGDAPRQSRRQDAYHAFVDEFSKDKYQGAIPVLVADQDMHRLTVAIARHGFTVSELNPADSHGVFGEYWQNRGPAVEEKLALTTVGLLVQHHLINTQVLESKNYYLI
jgi:hypothetical protein